MVKVPIEKGIFSQCLVMRKGVKENMFFEKEKEAKASYIFSRKLEEVKEENFGLKQKVEEYIRFIRSLEEKISFLQRENTSLILLKTLAPTLSPLLNSPNLSEETKKILDSLLQASFSEVLSCHFR